MQSSEQETTRVPFRFIIANKISLTKSRLTVPRNFPME